MKKLFFVVCAVFAFSCSTKMTSQAPVSPETKDATPVMEAPVPAALQNVATEPAMPTSDATANYTPDMPEPEMSVVQ